MWVRVEEAFKGAQPGQQFRLSQAAQFCAPRFESGERRLFYLRSAGVMPSCYRSPPANYAADDLLFLRALPGSADGNRLSGRVQFFEGSPGQGLRNSKNLADCRITISGKGRRIEAHTNADGVYEVYNLAPGSYRVDVEVPPGRLRIPLVLGRPDLRDTEIEMQQGSGIQVDFWLVADDPDLRKLLDQNRKNKTSPR